MSALPMVASKVEGWGPYWAAWSPIYSGPNSNIVWLSEPRLPNERYYRWATDAEVEGEHITLTEASITALLFIDGVEPADLDETSAAAVIGRALNACGCDLNTCAAEAAGQLYDNLGDCGRWTRCRTVAAALMPVEA